jgi:probable phosphoglycerate mutase
MPTLLLVRHGEITQSEPRRFVGRRDLPLTEMGQRQAEAWRRALAQTDLAGVWCSSLSRCRETAERILDGRGVLPVALDALREVSLGEWEGLSVEEVRQRFPGEYERRGADLADVAPAGGESFAEAQERAWTAVADILARTEGIALVVAHAGVNRALLCRALGMPLQRLFSLGQDYAALNILHFRQGREPVLQALNLPPLAAGSFLAALPALQHR